MLGPVSRVKLPSKYGRCALSVDLILPSTPSTPSTTCRLINVHLDSLGDTLPYRAEQMEILANLLREPGCGGGLIAGDFNAISPEDHALLDKNGLVDAWVALHGKKEPDGATWGVGMKRHDGLGPGRLDKVAMSSVVAKDMGILRPGLSEVPKPGEDSDYIPCSDHYGLRLGFTVGVLSSTSGLALDDHSRTGSEPFIISTACSDYYSAYASIKFICVVGLCYSHMLVISSASATNRKGGTKALTPVLSRMMSE